jgi:16S rRNA (uracil1498-N3)-methyltransferase
LNIILFDQHEIGSPLRRDDRRVIHILDVLRRQVGDATDVGLLNGPRGKAILKSVDSQEAVFEFVWGEPPPALLPIDLIAGLARPQTSRKILQEATSLGVRRIFFVATDRGEPSYATSKLWTTDEWRRLIRTGVEQAFSTWVPDVQMGVKLADAFNTLGTTQPTEARICLDNYEATLGLWDAVGEVGKASSVVLAVGSERGWTEGERNQFREHGFTMAHIGDRPLRTETAAIAAIGIAIARLPG